MERGGCTNLNIAVIFRHCLTTPQPRKGISSGKSTGRSGLSNRVSWRPYDQPDPFARGSRGAMTCLLIKGYFKGRHSQLTLLVVSESYYLHQGHELISTHWDRPTQVPSISCSPSCFVLVVYGSSQAYWGSLRP